MPRRPTEDEVAEAERWAKCASCGEGVEKSEALEENCEYYHPECAEVWRCNACGIWNEDEDETCHICKERKE
jgi:hypothetical protein